MSTFKDEKGVEWIVSINISTIKRVQELLGLNLLDIADGTIVNQLISDPILLVNCVYVICKKQADELGISDEDFGERMFGDVIAAATEAMLDALVSFTPNPQDRENLEKVLAKTQELMKVGRDQISNAIKNGALDKIGEDLIQAAGKPFTSSQESQE